MPHEDKAPPANPITATTTIQDTTHLMDNGSPHPISTERGPKNQYVDYPRKSVKERHRADDNAFLSWQDTGITNCDVHPGGPGCVQIFKARKHER